MLPKDAEKRRQNAKADKQSRLDPHLAEKPQTNRIISYTDGLFCDAAIEWLVSTDQVMKHCIFRYMFLYSCIESQPIQAFEHPAFRSMIHIAARATGGVKIPDRRQTRQAAINTFKEQLAALRKRLTVRQCLSL
jgi:hypothetical protein